MKFASLRTSSTAAGLLVLATLPAAGADVSAQARRVPTDGATTRLEAAVSRPPIASYVQPVPVLPALPAGVEELRFEDFYKLPVGPAGLEPSERLRSLEGKRVRLVGYFVFEDWGTCSCGPDTAATAGKPSRRPAAPAWMKHVVPGRIMLAPVPTLVSLGHYGQADDLPPQTAFLTISDRFGEPVYFRPGLFAVCGTLELGNRLEPDGRTSYVRLIVEREDSFQRAAQLSAR